MIKTLSCVVVACDGCNKDFSNGEFVPHYDDAAGFRDELEYADWWTDGKVHFCENCRNRPHDPVGDLLGACERCGVDLDEHQHVGVITQ